MKRMNKEGTNLEDLKRGGAEAEAGSFPLRRPLALLYCVCVCVRAVEA